MQKDTQRALKRSGNGSSASSVVYLAHALRYLSVYVCHTLYHKICLQPVHLLIDEHGERGRWQVTWNPWKFKFNAPTPVLFWHVRRLYCLCCPSSVRGLVNRHRLLELERNTPPD